MSRRLGGVFALALDEVVSSIADPRYLVPRWSLPEPPPGLRGQWERARSGWARTQRNDPVWHAVPSVLGVNRESAQAHSRAWNRWIGGGEAIYTRNPEGTGTLTACRGTNPMEMSSVLRTSWR